MFHIVLFQPEIPPNTGNIMRLAANTGTHLHLIRPLGFVLDDKRLRRAGLDYREYSLSTEHNSLEEFCETIRPDRLFACTTKGKTHYDAPDYQRNDAFIFGAETRGLPEKFLAGLPNSHKLLIPMQKNSRSLNLANAVAIIIYEAWRQCDFVF